MGGLMMLSTDTLRELVELYVGAEFDDAELERLRPLVERQFARMQELQRMDLADEDPRKTPYIYDRRLTP
jgi:hypothetical protein